ncbi:BRCT domain-containing protein [Vibrio maritimus]|uniref:BRCT domain-containing protein n=1 Tax=Vibrio maritimus TaxID=990268 RepID=UPI001F18B48D|nr:BRCT domain-containing protein [Vibrio maritimus]
MTIFELLGIKPGEAISADNPWSDSGYREVIPLALSRNGISIRAIDCRYGDICYVGADWGIILEDGSEIKLRDFALISKNLEEWNEQKAKRESAKQRLVKEPSMMDIERELATFDEVLSTIDIQNLKVAITGTLPLPRAKFKKLLEAKGAIVNGSVSSHTSLLFMGDTGKYEVTSKMKKAHALGVRIITL